MKQIKEYTGRLSELEEEKSAKTARMMELKHEIDAGKAGRIKVSGEVFVGVSVFIASKIYNVKQHMSHCMFKISEGEIEAVSF